MSTLNSTKTVVDIVVGVVGVTGAVIGVIWGYCEYIDRKAEGRVSETLKFVERFDQEPARGAHRRISRTWHAARDDVVRVLTKEYTESKWRKFVNDLVDDNDLAVDVGTLVDFYEALKICIDNNICDEATALAYFGKKASLFRNQHFVYFQLLQNLLNNPEIAQELEAIVRSYKDNRARAIMAYAGEPSICGWPLSSLGFLFGLKQD